MFVEVSEAAVIKDKRIVINSSEAIETQCRSRHVMHTGDPAESPAGAGDAPAANGVGSRSTSRPSSATARETSSSSAASHKMASETAVEHAQESNQEMVAVKSRCIPASPGCTSWYNKMSTNKTVLKVVFTLSVVSLLTVAYSLVVMPWFLPYHFTVAAPALLIQRAIRYWEPKWQPFLLDFCYFGNISLMIYLWACPSSAQFFAVIFAAINGPIAVATVIFRNSLVFHDADRMTSVFIHVVPVCVTYAIRWYPQLASSYWYMPFSSKLSDGASNSSVVTSSFVTTQGVVGIDMSLVWLVAVPLAWFTLHSVIYGLVESTYIGEDYLTSYRWLTNNEKSLTYKILTVGGRRKSTWIFVAFQWLYAFVGILLARLWYEYFTAHTVFLSLVSLCSIWNGASYYVDVFSKKGLPSSSQDVGSRS